MIAPPGPLGGPPPGSPRALTYAAAALRQLRKLATPDAAAVVGALEAYAATGAGAVRQLVDVRPPAYRLRVGELRAVFRLTSADARIGATAAIVVEWVGNRRDAY